MLNMTKQIQLTGSSMIEGEQVVFMSATLNSNGDNASINKSITNKELYDANKSIVRKDMQDFELEVYKIEDEMGGAANARR